ncbi:MAG: DNA cytosine methyltransferase, partial [Bacteroidales bacterium]|nr:DNA cytosine methyltransferase [Bacteroidales bacterium]
MQNTPENLDTKGRIWTEREFAYPDRIIRLGTSFSGIGAIEHAFQRLGLRTEILFAGDIEPNCKRAYFANYDIEETRWHNDIYKFNAKPF